MTDITQILSAFSDKPAATSGAAGSASASPAQFVQQVGPLAKAVADRLNVDPSILIGQWGLETGWGKSVIPGTNNLGNIKDFSGRGIAAVDNMTGSRDKYRQYDSLDGFGDDFAGLIERRYQGAIGAGSDAQRFAAELKAGGYAEDPAYVEKLVRAAEMARNAGASEGWMPGSRQPSAPAAPTATKPARVRLSEPGEFLSTDQGGKETDAARQQAMLDEGRTWGEAAADVGLGLTSGAGGIVELVGTGLGLASGDMDNALRSGGESLRKWSQGNQSKVLKAHKELRALRMDEMDEGPGKFFAYLAETLGSPELAIDFVAEQAPQLVVMGVTGRLAGGAAKAAGLGAEGAGRTATGVAIGSGAAMQGMDAAGQAYDSIKKVPRALQLENPTVQKLMAEGVPEEEAIERAARAAAATAGMASGGFSAVLNALPGAASIERALAGGVRQAGSRAAGALKGFVGEGVSEALDEVGGVGAANVATQEFDPSQSITEGMSEAAAAGALFAPFGGVSGALGAGIDAPPAPVVKPNSPLQNAASAAAAVTPPAPVGATPASGPEGSIAPSAADPAAERLARIQSFVEDKAFLQGIRVTPEFGKESVSELLSAYAKARNPSVDPLLREQAMADIEAFIETFNSRPNFTLGGSGQDATQAPGTAVAPVAPSAVAVPQAPTDDGMTIDGEFREPDDRLAGANPNQLPAPPVLELPTEDALQAARDADAAYEQAYQDLVKAEQLGASEAELQAYQRALIEAQQLRDQMDAQLAEADARTEAARQRESESRRREILASVISEGVPGVNPASDVAMRFTAELQRQGYREIVPNEDELRMIQRAVDVSAARPEVPEAEPSTPDEGQAASAPVARPAPAASSPRDKIAEVRQLVTDGWKPGQGRTLVSPTGKKRNINAIELAAAREAYRRKTATQGGADAVQPVQPNAAAQSETEAVPPAVGAAVSQEVTDAAPAQQVAEEAQAESGQKGEASEQEVAQPEIRGPIDAAAHEAATSPLNDKPEPTDGQKSAGNYAKGHIRLHGMDITIENPKGSVRSGTSPDGTAWQNVMAHHYGDIRGSKGADGDAIDVFITDDAESATVAWVIDQKNSDGSFDEHKAVIGAATEADAREAYLANYDEGWDGLGAITSMPMEAFRAWALDGKRKRKPLAYVAPDQNPIKNESGENAGVQASGAESSADESRTPEAFVAAPDGSIDFGDITPEMAQAMRRQAGKIRLQRGAQNANGTGWGLAHIEANHGDQIRNAGFESVQHFVSHVAKNFNEVLQAKNRQLLVAIDGGRQDVMFVQLEPDDAGDFYRINTAFPASRNYLEKQQQKGMKLLWGGSEPAPAAAGQQPPYAGAPAEESGQGAPIARGQSSDSSVAPESEQSNPQPDLTIQSFLHTKTKKPQYVVQLPGRVEREAYQEINRRALGWKGRWSGYDKDGAIPGFLFQEEAMANGFAADKRVRELAGLDVKTEAALPGASKLRAASSRGLIAPVNDDGRTIDPQKYAGPSDVSPNSVAARELATDEPSVDYKGFERAQLDNGVFELRDGNMAVRVESMGGDKFQASFRGAKSSPHLRGEQGAVDWAAAYRGDAAAERDADRSKRAIETPPTSESRALSRSPEAAQGAVLAKEGDLLNDSYGENAWQVIGDVRDSGNDGEPLRVRVNIGLLSERQKSVTLGELKTRIAEDRAFRDQLIASRAGRQAAKPDAVAPGTRINSDADKAAADRLQQVIDDFAAGRNTPEGAARMAMRSVIEELRKPRTAVDVVGLLETASSRLMRNYGAQARVVDEVIEQISADKKASGAKATPAPDKLDAASSALSDKKRAAAEKLKRLLDSRKGTLNSGVDPELMLAVAELGALSIADGAVKFAQWVRDVVRSARAVGIQDEQIKPFLKEAYGAIAANPQKYDLSEDQADAMDVLKDVRKADVDALANEENDKGIAYDVNNNAENVSNEQNGNDRGNESALAPVPPRELQDAEGGKQTGPRSRSVRGSDADGNGSPAEDLRDERDGGLAGEPGTVLPERPDRRVEEVEIAGEARPLEDVAESVKNDAPASEPKPKNPPRRGDNPGNYAITEADAIGTGTPGERIRANMAAIRLVLELERESRYPTREEQAVLAKYVGWGGLKNVFKGDNSTSKQEREAYAELKRILTPDQLFWMGQSVLNAHYTSPKVVGSMYKVLRHLGVDGGRFLEPTVGTGNFIGLMPQDMASSAKWFASEIDPITSLIAKHLYPEAQILPATGFQDAEFAYGRMDVAIGNPPFGDERITDTNKKRADINGFKIHNYVIAKSAMHLRPGGIMAFVVTSRFMDTANPEAREYLAKNFRLVGALRLPNNAFAENAGTEVTTDIVFLQRLRGEQRDGVTAEDMPWLDTKGRLLNQDGETVTLNRYFAENPGMLLGKPSMKGTMYGSRTEKGEFTLEPIPGLDFEAEIDRILSEEWAPLKGIGKQQAADREAAAVTVELNREDVPIGGYFRDGERVVQRVDDDADGNVQFRELTPETPWTEKQALGATRLARIKGMMALRESAYGLMALERADAPADQIEASRAELNRLYDSFVDEFGFLNDNANKALMESDPRIEFGLESGYAKAITAAAAKRLGQKAAPAKAEKSSLLRERVFYPKQEIESADSPADGYAISLSERGKLDLEYISELTGLSVERVIEDLSTGDAPLIFKDPTLGRWVQEDEYLSGNVKDKLRAARGAGLEQNIRALLAVQPADVPASEIHAEFGATWIKPSIYEDFLKLLGYDSAKVAVMPRSGAVEAVSVGNLKASLFRADIENPDYAVAEVFSAAANRRQLVAYDGRGDDRTVNQERTENLGRIRNKLIAIWGDWIKADPERAAQIERDYNEIMNTTVERKYDGVKHLRTVGANPSISLRNSQKIGAWRMIQSSSVLLDQVVGAGKTMTVITGIMERKRLGLSKKPMVMVPNHLVGQWARDWLQLYPGANVLAATEKDFAKANRRRLFARIATGKFDAIIVGHSSFGFIPVSREAEMEFIRGEVDHLNAALVEAEAAEGGKKGKGDSRRVRAIKNRIAKRMEKIRELQDKPRDNVVTFEDMGVDYLAVDELHEFKNLEYATTLSNVAGMGSPEGSKKAFDLYMKMRLLQEAGGGIAGATGTPISNSMVEMYSLLRYLNPGALAARNMEQFDAWVKAFASIEPRDEYTAAGKIKQRTVLAAFNNLPELLQMYKQVADTVTMKDLKRIYAEQVRLENEGAPSSKKKSEDFPVPKVDGGGRRLDIGEPTDEQIEFMDYLIARADILDRKKGKEKQEYAKIDNALWLMNDARKMSLDVRIIDPTAPDSPTNKVNRAADNIKSIYDKWDADLGTQLVFCDLSTPAKTATKDADKFITSALKALGFESDAAIKAAISARKYADKWAFLESRAELMIESGTLDDARRERIENFLEKVSDDDRSALVVADTGFSVYDALKAGLIARGIPEREVAFIHDANTSDQKRELFDLVNAGKVRVLIGSSAKMGAGTNVQNRIVALHHLDAPWRPSDIEQREGRAIRQGNLIAFDKEGNPIRKDFELEIIAYSTERTFDAQMWGVLARKAAFLEQFRSGLRSIKEEGGDAASYAEFMAEATGDQIFRDKLRLERELADIEAEDRSAKMKRSGAEQLLATADEKTARAESALAVAKRLASADLSSVTFEGKAYRNDLAEIIEDEMIRYREEFAAFQAEEEAYKIARKAWEDAAGTERGRAPAKPKAPEIPDTYSERVEARSQWAQMINTITRKMEMLPEGGDATYELKAANGVVVELLAERRGESSDRSLFIAGEWAGDGAARAPSMAMRLMPHRIMGDLRERPARAERALRSLRTNLEQAKATLERIKPIDPQAIADVRARYEAVKKAVDEASARMAEERSQRSNRFIAKDSRRFGGGAPASEVSRKASIPESARFRNDGTKVILAEGAKDVPFEGLEGYTFFAMKDGAKKTWLVVESTTGLSVGNGATKAEAISNAETTIGRLGLDRVKETIAAKPAITEEEKRAAYAAATEDDLRYEISDSGDPSPEEAKTVQAGIAGKNPIEAAAWLADNAPPEYATIAAKVRDKLQDLSSNFGVNFGLSIVHPGAMAESELSVARGATIPVQKDGSVALRIVLNGAGMKGRVGTSYRTALHELAHAATMQSIQLGRSGLPQYAQAVRDLVDVANAVRAHVLKRAKETPGELTDFERSVLSRRSNLLQSIDEVLAWGMTSSEAQAYLESIPYKSKSLWTAFVAAVRKALGLSERNDTALSEILRISEVLMEPMSTDAEIRFSGLDTRYAIQQPYGETVFLSPGGVDDATWTGEAVDEGAARLEAFVTSLRDLPPAEQPGSDAPAVMRTGGDSDALPETIEVDGLDRPTRNSNGKPIYPTEDGIRNFWRWFAGSKAVDAEGRPLVVYHGTNAKFDTFDLGYAEREDSWSFSTSKGVAQTYQLQQIDPKRAFDAYQKASPAARKAMDADLAEIAGDDGVTLETFEAWAEEANSDDPQLWAQDLGDAAEVPASEFFGPSPYGQMIEAYLKITNPVIQDFNGTADPQSESRPKGAPDGYILRNVMDTNSPGAAWLYSDVFKVLSSDQIKSATGNNGVFSPDSPSILLRDARPDTSSAQRIIDREEANAFIRGVVERYPEAPEIIAARTFAQLPEAVQQGARDQGSDEYSSKGVFHGGKVYVVIDNHSTIADLEATVFHELLGHAGVRKMLGAEFSQKLNQVFIGLGGQAGLVRIMKRRGMGDQMQRYILGAIKAQKIDADRFRQAVASGDPRARRVWTDAMMRSVLTEEVLAHIAEQIGERPGLLDRFMEMMGRIRQWLRDHGFAKLSNLGESDLLYMLSKSRETMRGPDGPNGGKEVRVTTERKKDDFYRDGSVLSKAEKDALSVVLGSLDGNPAKRDRALQAMRMLGLSQEPGVTVFSVRGSEGQIEAVSNAGDGASASATPNTEPPAVLRTGGAGLADFASSREGRSAIRNRIADVFDAVAGGSGVRTFNWWNRTVGSQYHKAKKSPEFRKVYELAHAYVDEISRIANTAAGQAKNILPHLDSWKDIGAGLNIRKQWADAKDYQAIASAVFDGTLANGSTGTVWTDEQLRDQFGLNDKQIGLYREFRAAVDVSLESLATSEMARAARVAKLETADPEMTMSESLAFYTDQVDAVIEKAKADIEDLSFGHEQERTMFEEEFGSMRPGATEDARKIMAARQRQEMAELETALRDAESLRSNFTDKASQIRKLQSEGYAPLMRFGQYTVDVVRLDEDGNPAMNEAGEPDRPFFGMFETEAEAREAERVLREEYPDYTVTRGIMSTKANEMFKGVTPETAEMFARLLGTDQEGAFQAYLKQAVANRSAMKRLIERKGMAGFAQDVPRVLAAFVTSNARLSAGNWHFGEMNKAVQDIPREMGDVKDEAIKLVDYIQNPQEEAAGLRGFLFFSFLGGSVAAALVNTTQTLSTTLPYLHQFSPKGSAAAITRAMGVAYKAMRKGLDVVKDDDMRAALKRAADEGVVDPQEIHLLMAESGGNGASSFVGSVAGMVRGDLATPASRVSRAATQAWGSLFGMAEKYNRHVAFMAAWEVAGNMSEAQIKATGAKDRYDFAKRAVTETQFEYRKISRPNWARGAIGATLFTFKTFLVNYLEFVARLPARERALAIAVLLLMAGMSGAPGLEDMEDLIDTIGQKFGYNWNSAASRHAWMMKTLGEGGANFVEHGISSFLPIDVSARLGVGNIIPASDILKKSNDQKWRSAAELLGPIGSVIEGATKVFDGIGTNKAFGELIRPVAPKAYNDIYQAIDILQTGYYRDSRGRKVVEADALDAFMKSIGFQPNAVAEPRRVEWMIGQSVRMQRVIRSDIYELWSRGVFESDAEKVALAKAMLVDWNRKNPETPIKANPQSIAQRVKAMRSTSAERTVKATPKEMRGMISDQLAITE